MSKRSPKSVEEKLEVVQLYLNHHQSISSLVKQFRITNTTLREWIRRYEQSGVDGLKESRHLKAYSLKLKAQTVRDYLEGRGSQHQIAQNYHISDSSVLRRWIKRYISGKQLTATSKMKQGRKTTFEERVEIVNFTIAHDKNYQAAIEAYGVSYQQVYS